MPHSKPSLTIRMGAAHWDATLPDGTTFDFVTMTRDQRRAWYGTFMATCRRIYGHNDRRRAAPLPKGKRRR